MNAINEAIAKAQEAAAETITDMVPATTQGEAPSVPDVYVPARTPSMVDAMSAVQLRPDEWLKVKEHGLLLGTSLDAIETLTVEIDMTENEGFFVKQSIKYGNPAVYLSTYDGVTCDKGGAWESAVVKAQAADNKAKVYYCADIKMRLVQDAKNLKGKKHEFGESGKMLGHTTSTTNFEEWRDFYSEVSKADLLNKKVLAVLSAKPLKNKNNNVWGVIVFTLVGAADMAKA